MLEQKFCLRGLTIHYYLFGEPKSGFQEKLMDLVLSYKIFLFGFTPNGKY